jgi:hypothetical protein
MRNKKSVIFATIVSLISMLILNTISKQDVFADCHTECECLNWVEATCGNHAFCCWDCSYCDWEHCWEECDCSPTSCHGCTPSCPAGQSTTVSGPLCQQGISSCTGTNNCDPCTLTGGSCYLPETNSSPSAPSEIDMSVGTNDYDLSPDSGNPTKIKQPMENETVTLTVPELTPVPLTARGIGYYFRAYENVTEIFSSPEPTGQTLTDPNPDPNFEYTQEFTNADDLLDGGFSGKADGRYYTFDKCNYTVQYSSAVEGYFTVDNIPPTPGPNPNVCDPEVEVCDKFDYLPELGSLQTTRGCESTDYVGQEINNPLAMEFSMTDEDGNSEVEALAIWFRSSTTTPALPTTMEITTGDNEGIDNDNFGILIRKDTDWTSTKIYQSMNDGGGLQWKEITDGQILDPLGVRTLTVLDLEVDTVTNPSIDISFKLQFHYGEGYTADPITDEYEIYAQGLDTSQIYDNTVEVDKLDNIFDIGIDLINPTTESTQITVNDVTEAELSWTASDSESGVERNIINALVSPPEGDVVSLRAEEPDLPVFIPGDYETSEIGYFDDNMTLVILGNSDNDILVDIGSNETGSIDMYVTTYDYACNYSGASDQINLEPWIATKGGTFYSREGVKTRAKDIEGMANPTFNNFTDEEVDQGTELLSARTDFLYQIMHPAANAVAASQVYDSNQKKTYWFGHLQDKFQTQKLKDDITLQELTSPDMDCASGEYCYYESTNDIDLTDPDLPTTYSCTGNKLIISEENIIIDPTDYASGTTDRQDGCIYVAKGDIEITGGDYWSNPDVEYDYFEGFFIAEGQIEISMADGTEEIRDGLEIKGGLVAFGNEITGDAISINRNLRLYNLLYPTVLVNHDFKYGRIAETFFGREADIYKQEVGLRNI